MGTIKTKNDSSGMKLGDYYSSAKRQNLFVGADGFADTEDGGLDPQEVEEMIDEYMEVHREEFKGDNGVNGEDGYTPVRGVDYFTASDVSHIVELVLDELHVAEER